MQTLPHVKHDSTKQRARRGLGILGALLLAAVMVFNLDVAVDWFRGYIDVVALVPQTSGVRIGSPVWVEGVEAGRVTALDFMGLGDNAVVALHVRLEDRVSDVVRRDSRAYAVRRRFIGEPTVEIGAGSPDAPAIESGDTLFPSDRPTLQELIEQGLAFPGALDSLGQALAALQDASAGRERDIDRVLHRLEVASREASTLRSDMAGGSLDRWLSDPDLGRRIHGLRARVTELEEAAGAMAERYADPALTARVATVAVRADRLGRELADLERALAEGDGVLGRMARDSALTVAIHGVQAQIDSLRAAGLGFALRMLAP